MPLETDLFSFQDLIIEYIHGFIGNPYIDAFVVGTTFKEKFNLTLGKKLSEHYDDLPGMQLFKQVDSSQLSTNFEEMP